MPFEPPRTLSPSKVTSFRDCALAFRFNAIDHLPDLPTTWTVKGTFVHSVLEGLFWNHGPGHRTPAAAHAQLDRAWTQLQDDPDYRSLALTEDQAEQLRTEAGVLVDNYFALEDPNEVTPVGIELLLEARVGSMRLRGILDRLDLTPEGDLMVIDYKTGRAPSAAFEQSKLIGVHIYALLCQEVLGRRPVQVRLLHLKEPTVIIAEPTEQAVRGQRIKTQAVWSAIERACHDEDFRPRTSPLCKFCRFQAFCPAYGGDPAQATVALGATVGGAAVTADAADDAPGFRSEGPGSPGTAGWTGSTPTGTGRTADHTDGRGGLAGLAGLVRVVDDRVDSWFEPLRGKPAVDGMAKMMTGLGDQGIMWAATTVWRARHSGPERAQSVRALTIAGIESTIVNRALKLAVGRSRPDPEGAGLSAAGVPVRAPTSSSFPSGHTLAAFCAVTVMSRRNDRAGNALLFTAASLVGLSRLHLRAHHASDVLGGAAIGVALGLLGRRLL